MMAAEGQRGRRVDHKRVAKSIARVRKTLEAELAELDQEIGDQVRGSPVWREKEDLLVSVPGVGPVVARTLLALGDTSRDLYLFDTFTGMTAPTAEDRDHRGQPASTEFAERADGDQSSRWCRAGIRTVRPGS